MSIVTSNQLCAKLMNCHYNDLIVKPKQYFNDMGWTGVHMRFSEAPPTGSTALLQAQVITVETRMKIFCSENSSILSWRAENIIQKKKLQVLLQLPNPPSSSNSPSYQ